MEERINRRLEEEFTKEDSRLQSALSELRRCVIIKEGEEGGSNSKEEKSCEELSKAINDAESVLAFVQSYELVECDLRDNVSLKSYELRVERQVSSEYLFRETQNSWSQKRWTRRNRD